MVFCRTMELITGLHNTSKIFASSLNVVKPSTLTKLFKLSHIFYSFDVLI